MDISYHDEDGKVIGQQSFNTLQEMKKGQGVKIGRDDYKIRKIRTKMRIDPYANGGEGSIYFRVWADVEKDAGKGCLKVVLWICLMVAAGVRVYFA